MRIRVFVAILVSAAVFAQTPPAFDAASVKVSPPMGPGNTFAGTKLDPGRAYYANLHLITLITAAFRVEANRVAGLPSEFDSPTYTIEATHPADIPKEQIPLMLQSLLAERFKLRTHHETRQTPAYVLVVAKNGPKIKPSEAATQTFWNLRAGMFEATKIPLGRLASLVSNSGWVDRIVIDRTNLTGDYDFSLKWTPENMKTDDTSALSIFTAVQEQWGLKLEPQTLPLDSLVIDHVEKPSDN